MASEGLHEDASNVHADTIAPFLILLVLQNLFIVEKIVKWGIRR